jgi:hypothetical protein
VDVLQMPISRHPRYQYMKSTSMGGYRHLPVPNLMTRDYEIRQRTITVRRTNFSLRYKLARCFERYYKKKQAIARRRERGSGQLALAPDTDSYA